MKKITLITLLIALILGSYSCKKTEPTPSNAFTFKGKTYPISLTGISRVVLTSTTKEIHVYQFLFGSVSGTDTTLLAIAVSDTLTTNLGGNYQSLDMSSEAPRGILPFVLVAASGLLMPNMDQYFTGAGGSVDISFTPAAADTTYSLNFNNISAGVYADKIGGGYQYTEAGKINGNYKGIITMEEVHPFGALPNAVPKAFLPFSIKKK